MEIKNKKGASTFGIILLILVGFFLLIFMIVLSYGMGVVDDSFSKLTGSIGNTSINGTYIQLMQPGVLAVKTTFPQVVSTGVLLGMVILMVIVGYNKKKVKQVWAVLDLVILILCEALAVLIASSFQSFLDSNEAFLAIARDILPGGAKFILNMPILVPIIGAIVMLATYMITTEKEEAQVEDAGF